MTGLSEWLQDIGESMTRKVAQNVSRRSFLSGLAKSVAGAAMLPLLPVDRSEASENGSDNGAFKMAMSHENGEKSGSSMSRKEKFAANAQTEDPTKCNYWRYCATDGYQCASCGGGPTTCPPGTEPSPSSWVGSCINPDDGEEYLIAYRDCCGKDSCARGACLDTIEETPTYRPQRNNDIVWCFGTSMVYHCSSAAVIGKAS